MMKKGPSKQGRETSSNDRAQHHTLYQLTDALTRAASLTEVYDSALDSILATLGCDRAALLLSNEDGVMQFKAWRGLSDAYRQAAEGHSPWKPGEKNPRLLWIEDVARAQLQKPLRTAIAREGIGALAFVPLLSHGKLLGKFMVYFDCPHTFTPDELQIAQAVANQVGFGIERRRNEEALRDREERIRRLVSLMPAAVYTCDAEGRITFFNRRAAEIWGRDLRVGDAEEKFCGAIRQWRADGSPLPHDQTSMAAAVRSGKSVRNVELILEQPAGKRIMVSENVDPLFDQEGRCLGAINVFEDITERRHAEDITRRLAAIVEYSDDAIISKDLNGTIITWNQGAQRLFGYTVEEAVGQNVSLLIPPERLHEEPRIIERIRRGESVEHYETVRRHKDGMLLDISLTVSPLRDEQGKVVGASKIARDITERKRAERMVREAQAQLEQHAISLETMVTERTADLRATNEQLEAFVYTIAHDLRAPLRSMEGFSAVLLEEAGAALGEQGRNYARRINRSAQFMGQLLTDLLAFSQLNQQRIILVPSDPGLIVEGALSLLENEMREKNAQVDCSGPWPLVLAHAPTLGQVLYNLLSNALKFVAPGVQPVVRLLAEVCPAAALSPPQGRGRVEDSPGDWVRIWVEDNGIGIALEHQEQIFRLFTRLEGEKYSGTGIGLAIVQKGTERMNGRAGVESQPGQGSRFWIELKKA